jgi:hypothetical protein
LLDEERRMLEEELGRFFGGYLVHYGPSPRRRRRHRRCSATCAWARRCRGSRSSAKSRPGR